MTWGQKLGQLIDPPIPESVREDYLLHSARRLRAQGVLLFGGIGIACPAVALALGDKIPTAAGVGLPLVMSLLSALAIAWLLGQSNAGSVPERAETLVLLATRCALGLGLIASIWSAIGWLAAPPEARLHFPLLCALGTMSIAYCVASVRRAAIASLVVGLMPITLVMGLTGTTLDLAAAAGILVAAGFQLATLGYQHINLVELLQLQRKTRELSQTDALTGLVNRRALLDYAVEESRANTPMRLMLLDIDQFKRINDSRGHEMGDEVLREVSAILGRRRKPGLCVARIGGEEFALLGPESELPEAVALAILAEMRNTVMPHGEQVTISIGIAEATITDEASWRKLYARADTALYRAKRDGRNRLAHCQDEEIAGAPKKPRRAAA